MTNLITIILPVYGRPKLLKEAIDSVYEQDDPQWNLLIADDGSDIQTQRLFQSYASDPRVTVLHRTQNLGLFGNLNATLDEVKSPWQLILCSDDRLEPFAIRLLKQSIRLFPQARLVLSSYRSIDLDGNLRYDVNGKFYDCFAPRTHLFEQGDLLQYLLKYGSINGNITGLLIHHSLFQDAGHWRSDWSQSSDWEWLIRASCCTPVLVRREPIASVRVHTGQLSVSNRKHQRETWESLHILYLLLNHPMLSNIDRRYIYAAHHAQFLLLNILKTSATTNIILTIRQLVEIHKKVGIVRTLYALIRTLPIRLRQKGSQLPLLPPD